MNSGAFTSIMLRGRKSEPVKSSGPLIMRFLREPIETADLGKQLQVTTLQRGDGKQ